MKYKYSICYPDKSEIEFVEEIIEENQIVQLVQSFDWDNEVIKEIEHYSPSLDFINLKNKKRLILSGIGKEKLSQFQVTYVIPNDENCEEAFDDDNYYDTEEYYANCDIETSYEILNEFLNLDYEAVVSIIQAHAKEDNDSIDLIKLREENYAIMIAATEPILREKRWWEFWK